MPWWWSADEVMRCTLRFMEIEDVASLLRCCRCLSRSRLLALGAAECNGFTMSMVHPMFGDDEGLARHAVWSLASTAADVLALWHSMSPRLKADPAFAGYASGRFADVLFPSAMLNQIDHRDICVNPVFLRSFVEATNPVDTRYMYYSTSDVTVYFPHDMMLDRNFALLCAQKGFWPFGDRFPPLWTDDEEIIAAVLQHETGDGLDLNESNDALPPWSDVARMVMNAPAWGGKGAVLRMVEAQPRCSLIFCPLLTMSDVGLLNKIIDICSEHNKSRMPHERVVFVRGAFKDLGLWRTSWRRMLCLGVMHLWSVTTEELDLDSEADIELLMTSVRAMRPEFRRFLGRWQLVQDERAVALAVLSVSPLSIQGTDWAYDKEVALAAVRSDGRCLKHLSRALRADHDVVIAAVCQTWMAVAWIETQACRMETVVEAERIACEQNPLATSLLLS